MCNIKCLKIFLLSLVFKIARINDRFFNLFKFCTFDVIEICTNTFYNILKCTRRYLFTNSLNFTIVLLSNYMNYNLLFLICYKF